MKTLLKFYKFAKLVTSSKISVSAITIMTFILMLFTAFSTNDLNYHKLVKEIGNINITIGIGLGALAIAISKTEEVTEIIWTVLTMLSLGLMSYLLSISPFSESISKAYFYLNIMMCLSVIISFCKFLFINETENKKTGVK